MLTVTCAVALILSVLFMRNVGIIGGEDPKETESSEGSLEESQSDHIGATLEKAAAPEKGDRTA